MTDDPNTVEAADEIEALRAEFADANPRRQMQIRNRLVALGCMLMFDALADTYIEIMV